MAFVGAGNTVYSSGNIQEINGLALGAVVSSFDATGAAADSGLLATNPAAANAFILPATFGPGPGKWTVAHTAALRVQVQDASAVANVRIAVSQKALAGGNLTIGVHSLELGLPAAITVHIDAEHTETR